jgi:chromosome segregation ATPase
MDTIQQQGQYLCYLIAGLAVCIFVIQIYAVLFYRRERSVITRYHRFLNENPDVDLDDALGRRQVSKDSPLRKRIALIKEAVRHKRPAAVSEFSALSDENDHSHWFNSIPTTFIGLFLIFGLGGTLYLLNTLLDDSDLKSIVEASGDLNTIKLREAVGKLYGGFGHAFVASLAGIGATCGLVLVRGVWVNPIRGLFYHDLDSLTVTELLPRLQPREVALPDALVITSRALEQVGEKMLAMVEIVQAASDNNKATAEIAQKAVGELGGFSDGMKAAANALDRSVRRLDSTFGEEGVWAKRNVSLDQGMSDLSVRIGRNSELTDALTVVTKNLRDLVGDSVEKITPMLPDLGEFLASHRERILTVADRLAGIDANLSAVDRRLDSTIGVRISNLTTAISSLQEILSPLSAEQLAPLGANVLSLDRRMESLNGSLQDGFPRMNTRLATTEKEIVAVLGVLNAIQARLAPLQSAAEAVVSPLQAGTKAIECLAEFAPDSVSCTRELASSNVELVSSQQSLGKGIEPLVSSLSGLKHDIAGIHGKLATVEFAGSSIVNTGKSVETAIQTLAIATEQWKNEVAQLSGLMGEQTQESERLRNAIETQRVGHPEGGLESKGGFFHNWRSKQ